MIEERSPVGRILRLEPVDRDSEDFRFLTGILQPVTNVIRNVSRWRYNLVVVGDPLDKPRCSPGTTRRHFEDTQPGLGRCSHSVFV
jgi:hypothetical protein